MHVFEQVRFAVLRKAYILGMIMLEGVNSGREKQDSEYRCFGGGLTADNHS